MLLVKLIKEEERVKCFACGKEDLVVMMLACLKSMEE